jgi:hypothetical protein
MPPRPECLHGGGVPGTNPPPPTSPDARRMRHARCEMGGRASRAEVLAGGGAGVTTTAPPHTHPWLSWLRRLGVRSSQQQVANSNSNNGNSGGDGVYV